MVKPLDLNVSIQNSYEAARVEAVRLEREHVLNRLSGEDSLREQRLRDSQVSQPEAKVMHDDLFSAEAYEAPDNVGQGEAEKKQQREHKAGDEQEPKAPGDQASEEVPANQAHSPGFSTYA